MQRSLSQEQLTIEGKETSTEARKCILRGGIHKTVESDYPALWYSFKEEKMPWDDPYVSALVGRR